MCALGVFAATWLVVRPALDNGWLDWDDAPLLREKEEWRGLSLDHLRWMFTTFHMGPYQPLSWVSYALDHAFYGLDPRGYHLTNVLLHAASAVCLFFLARELFGITPSPSPSASADADGARDTRPWLEIAAAFTALFWSIHPLRVESVAWITERRDCLSEFFLLLALLAWLAHVRSGDAPLRGIWYRLALASFAASLLAKGLGLVLPLVLLVLDAWPLGRFSRPIHVGHVGPAGKTGVARARSAALARARALVLEKWPFFLLALVAAVLAVVGQKVTGAVVRTELHGASARIAQAFYGLAFYVRKTVWPSDLMVLYPMRVPLDAGEMRFVASMVGVALGAALLVIARRRAPAALAAFAGYALIVFPVLGFVQTGSQLVADRYAYSSSIPLALLAGGSWLWLARRIRGASSGDRARGRAALGTVVLLLGGAVLAPLALATRRQIGVWHDTIALWQHDLAIDPDDNPARRNLIAAYEDQGRAATDPARRRASFERALDECRKGMERVPDAACLSSAAKIYDLLAADEPAQREHDLELALHHARRSVELVERTLQRLPEAYESCGAILSELGRPADAVPYFEKMVALDPGNATRQGMLGEALLQAGRGREALVPLEAARRIAPDSTAILLDLGDAHRQLGEAQAALECYRSVVEIQRRRLGAAAATDNEYASALQAIQELGRKH